MNLIKNMLSFQLTRLLMLSLLTSCASISNYQSLNSPLACDSQGLGQLQIDNQTKIVAVQNFKAGQEVRLSNSPGPHKKTSLDVCMVKLVVGPGNPGPANVPLHDTWNRY